MASFPRSMSVASSAAPSHQFSAPLRSDDNGDPLPPLGQTLNDHRSSQFRYSDAPTSSPAGYTSRDPHPPSGHYAAGGRYRDFDQGHPPRNPFENHDHRASRYSDNAGHTSPQSFSSSANVKPGAWGGQNEGYTDDDFNVADDFNNAGPTYSEVYGGSQMRQAAREGELDVGVEPERLSSGVGANGGRPGSMRPKSSFRPASQYSSLRGDDSKSTKALLQIDRNNPNGVEMVTVPALGAEWEEDEIYRSSKKGRSELTSEKRGRAWTEWKRGHTGLCGVKWLTKRSLVFLIFGFCVVLGLVLFFTLPRPPVFSVPTSGLWTVDNSTVSFSRTPANYSFAGQINLFADASSTYLPVHVSTLSATVYDYATSEKIGTGTLENRVLKREDAQPVSIPVEWSYVGSNSSDVTWLDMYDSCAYVYTGTVRPEMSFRVVIEMSILGLVTKPSQSLTVLNLECPFQRASNSV